MRAYEVDWPGAQGWCAGHGLAIIQTSPGIAGLYREDGDTSLFVATLTRRVLAIEVQRCLPASWR